MGAPKLHLDNLLLHAVVIEVMKKKIAVIGYGYVGQAVTRFFQNHFDVIARDLAEEHHIEGGSVRTIAVRENDWVAVNAADLAIVCVPTPMQQGGRVDTSAVEAVLERLEVPLVLIKSTIPPGTTDRLIKKTGKKIAFSPEYIGEGNYIIPWWKDKAYPHPTDMHYHDFHIFGGEASTTSAILQFFKRVAGPEATYRTVDAKTAELCKYMENAFFATKVTFCNEFFEIAKAFGIDYDSLRELWLLDGRIGRMHTAVFEDQRGFGGKCLPKDLAGIITTAKGAGHAASFLESVARCNEAFTALNARNAAPRPDTVARP
jgi:UDPglucose 6-dehydrogenase